MPDTQFHTRSESKSLGQLASISGATIHKSADPDYIIEDVAPLERAGFTGSAANMRKQIEEGRRIIEEQKLAEMTARNNAREEAIRNKPQGFHPTKNIDFNSPEAQKARRDWGLSDDIGLGR